MEDWVTVRTHPGSERKATEHLHRQGYETFFPRFREVQVRRGRRVEQVQFLFPTYGFVDVSTGVGSLRSVRGTRGVAGTLESDGCIQQHELSSFIRRLRASADAEGFVVLPAPPGRRIGDKVRIDQGVFAGMSGVYDGQTSQQRVFVLLRLMKRTVRARLYESDLAA